MAAYGPYWKVLRQVFWMRRSLWSVAFPGVWRVSVAADRAFGDRQLWPELDQHAAAEWRDRPVVCRAVARCRVPARLLHQPDGRVGRVRDQCRAGHAPGLRIASWRARRPRVRRPRRRRHASGGAADHVGLRLPDRIQHRRHALAGQHAAADRGPCHRDPALSHQRAADRPASSGPRSSGAGGRHAGSHRVPALHRHRPAEPAPKLAVRPGHGRGPVHR